MVVACVCVNSPPTFGILWKVMWGGGNKSPSHWLTMLHVISRRVTSCHYAWLLPPCPWSRNPERRGTVTRSHTFRITKFKTKCAVTVACWNLSVIFKVSLERFAAVHHFSRLVIRRMYSVVDVDLLGRIWKQKVYPKHRLESPNLHLRKELKSLIQLFQSRTNSEWKSAMTVLLLKITTWVIRN